MTMTLASGDSFLDKQNKDSNGSHSCSFTVTAGREVWHTPSATKRWFSDICCQPITAGSWLSTGPHAGHGGLQSSFRAILRLGRRWSEEVLPQLCVLPQPHMQMKSKLRKGRCRAPFKEGPRAWGPKALGRSLNSP